MINWITFNEKSLKDFGVYISGSGVFDAPERDYSSVEVPGRNGELTLDNGRYKNITVEYPAFIIRDFKRNVAALRNFLLANRGFCRLEDTYHPEEYRIAKWDGKFTADPVDELYAANFKLTFDCYPQRFLKIGEMPIELTASATIFNEYLQESKPLIRAYGTGSFTISGVTITINSANSYTDIDKAPNCQRRGCHRIRLPSKHQQMCFRCFRIPDSYVTDKQTDREQSSRRC